MWNDPVGSMGRLEIDISYTSAALRDERSSESCSRKPVWDIRNTGGIESFPEETDDGDKNRTNRKDRIIGALHIMTQTIDGFVGKKSIGEK